MRVLLAALLAGLVVAPVTVGATGIRAVLKAPAANPKINAKWRYSITVTTLAGKPVKARLTAHVIDPIGGVHPMDYGPTGPPNPGPPVPIKNRPFVGTFRDYLQFPPESRFYPLTLRWTVKAKVDGKTKTKVLTRKVTPG